MKVLAIMSSPRKKDSFHVTQKIEKILSDQEGVEFEYLFLSDHKLLQCVGCYDCLQHGERSCRLTDDRDLIFEKMKAADGIIFVTPSYAFQVSSNLKMFIERFAFLSLRPLFFDKAAMIVTTCSSPGYGLKEPTKYLRLILFAWGFKKTFDIGNIVPIGYAPSEETAKRNERTVTATTKAFYSSLTGTEKPKPSFKQLMQFKFLKMHSEVLHATYRADYEYYKAKDFFYDTDINPFHAFFAGILLNLIRKKLSKAVKA